MGAGRRQKFMEPCIPGGTSALTSMCRTMCRSRDTTFAAALAHAPDVQIAFPDHVLLGHSLVRRAALPPGHSWSPASRVNSSATVGTEQGSTYWYSLDTNPHTYAGFPHT